MCASAESALPNAWLLDEWTLLSPFLAKGTRALTLYFAPISKSRKSSISFPSSNGQLHALERAWLDLGLKGCQDTEVGTEIR